MFSIITEQTIQEFSRLEEQVSELLACELELEQAVRELRELSGMEGLIEGLMQRYLEIEDEFIILNQILLVLNKTILNYLDCENRICSNTEESVIFHTGWEIGTNDFSGISDILNKIWEQ